MNSSDEKHSIDEKDLSQPQDSGVRVSVEDVDTGAMLAAGIEGTLDPAEAAKIRKKIDLHIIPLMVQYMDKATLGSSSILGIKLSTCFYLAYLVMEFPQNLALQRFPVAKWLSINIFVWGVALCSHAACKSFVGLLIVRIILGVCEGFLIVTAMFYTRKEQGIRAGYWFLMNGAAQIISGFISFGTLHIETNSLEPWQWLMLITGIITLITAVAFWYVASIGGITSEDITRFLFPDSPTTAWFLTPDERAKAILRIKENQTGLENKHFKKEQSRISLFYPSLTLPQGTKNPSSSNLSGSPTLQTTLLTMVDGGVEIVTILIGVNVAARTGQRAYTAVVWKIPNIVAAILINTLPWSNKIGLLFSFWIVGWGTTAFVIAVAWLNTVTAGHTKRVTTNAILLIAYCVGNAAAPANDKYKPRNHVPWIIICCCFVSCMVLLLVIRWVLSRENKRRDRQGRSDVSMYDDVYIERLSPDGVLEKVKVDKEFLDLTDIQNQDFRYVL
ncbi:MFS general substrate transporter [Mycena amicta]|nr:MFS general substrate transporter [Mycena amicta]